MISLKDKKEQLEQLRACDDTQQLIDRGSAILGNPMAVIDTSYKVLLHTSNVETDDWIWNNAIPLGYFSHELVTFFNNERFIDVYAKSDVVAFLKSPRLKYDRLNGKLFDDEGVQVGDISLVSIYQPLDDDDYKLFELFCEIVSEKLVASRAFNKNDRVFLDTSLESLVHKKLASTKGATENDSIYSGLKKNIYLAVADISGFDPTFTHLAYFRDYFKTIQSEFEYFVYGYNVIFLVSTDKPCLESKTELAALYDVFVQNRVVVGISASFQTLKGLKNAYREALNALNYGTKGRSKRNIFFYDDYRVEHYINSTAKDYAPILSPVATLLVEYDRENKTALSDTLYYYLLYARDIDAVCAHMGIDKADVNQSLKTITQNFAVDLTNGEAAFNVFASFKLLRE